jgi:hypothetical protein
MWILYPSLLACKPRSMIKSRVGSCPSATASVFPRQFAKDCHIVVIRSLLEIRFVPTLASVSQPALWAFNTQQGKLDALLATIDNVTSAANATEVRQYVHLIRQNLVTPLNGVQDLALRDVVGPGEFLDRTTPLAFVNMDRFLIALQLVARIIDYNRIQQRGHSLCGPVTLMHDFAKREAVGYVRYVMGLAENRRGYIQLFGQAPKLVKVKRRSNILTKTVERTASTTGIVDADYIALVSLREDASALPYRAALTNTMLQGATTASEMKSWMEEMGYSNVEDHTLNRMWAAAAKMGDLQAKFSNHITSAKTKLNNGQVIFLCAAGKLTQFQLNQPVSTGVGGTFMTYFGGHWMLCRDIDINAAQGVRFALDSWGKSSQTGGTDPWLPWSKVTSWYRGYVSGHP